MQPEYPWRSKSIVVAECDSKASPYCKGFYRTRLDRYKANLEKHNGVYFCRFCSLLKNKGVVNWRNVGM